MDIYQMITDRIIADLQKGTIPWEKPWINTSGTNVSRSHIDGRVYSLLNQMMLGIPGEYVTFKQAQKEGGHIKKGAKSKQVFFFKMIEKKDSATDEEKLVPFLRYSSVFHIEDAENIAPKFVFSKGDAYNNVNNEEIDKAVQDYITRSGVTLRLYEQNKSFYSPSEDEIILPHMNQFVNSESYYATLFHEMGHSTGAANRLDRQICNPFGSKAYSREELVAEITSAVLCNRFGIDTEKINRNTSAYVQSWLKVLSEDSKAVVWAAGRAEKAVKMILNEKDTAEEEAAA